MNNLWTEFVAVIRDGYRNWRVYSARSTRKEFWLWALHVWFAALALSAFKSDFVSFLFLIPLVPSLSMWVRRIHDTGHRVWWLFIPGVGGVITLIFLLSGTNHEETRWSRPGMRSTSVRN